MPDPVFLSGDAVPDYLRGVELLTAGMEWPASTGPVTITMEHIADAIRAANEDPHIQPPRIKLGHGSPLNGDHPDHDPWANVGDAEPAFGIFANLRAENDGAVLVGDADRILTWLAESAPATYPNRSSEATWQVQAADFDVQTAGGKRYSMVVTAVSLLGVYIPAIGDLEDLSTLIMNGPAALQASASDPASLAGGQATPGVALSISEDEIRQRFNWEWAMDPENELDTYWWWCREVRVTNGEVIADDDQGHLWQVAFDEKDGLVTFGEPEQVRKTYIPVAASTTEVACFARPSKPQRPPVAAAGSDNAADARPEPEGVNMDDDVREFLVAQGFDPDTVTEVQINAARLLMAEQPEAEATTDDAPAAEAGDTPTGEAETPETERVPVAAAAAPDPITAAKDKAFEDLAAEVASLRAERDANVAASQKASRDSKVSAALTAGKITPAEREHYRGLYDIDEERTDALLAALPADRVPLEARANVPDPEGTAIAVDDDGFLQPHLSLLTSSQRAELRARRAS